MSEQISDRAGLPNLFDRMKQLIPAKFRRDAAVVPVVRLSGVIGAVTPLRPGLTLAGIAKTLERAFATKHAKAVALVINSPGGSPVQSRQIYLRIRQLAAEKKLPVLVFVEDVAASGGYMIACAGDEIFCDPSSILGSIGVVGGGFGFQDLIKRIGVERRLYTAGEHKAMLDPFLPEDPDDVARLKALQREIHAIFIALVKGQPRCAAQGQRGRPVHRRILGGREVRVAGPCGQDRRYQVDAARALWREGADARHRARKRDAGRPVGPEVAGGGRAGRPRRYRGTAGRPDFRAGDPGDLGQIRVLEINWRSSSRAI